MLEKNTKISVLQKLIGFGKERADNTMVVPQNSLTQMRQKLGLMEYETLSGQRPNSFQNQSAKSNTHCPHCENMAKNFLYLESLVRSNFTSDDQCNLCNATLKYLQYVNKNIADVFGNFDSIVQASRAFNMQAKHNAKPQQTYPVNKSRPVVEAKNFSEMAPKKLNKQRQSKSKGKTVKVAIPTTEASKQQASIKRMTGGGGSNAVHITEKQGKTRSKHSLRKTTAKKGGRTSVLKLKEHISENGTFENSSKTFKKPTKSAKLKLTSSSRILRPLKPKSAKSKLGKNKKLHVNK